MIERTEKAATNYGYRVWFNRIYPGMPLSEAPHYLKEYEELQYRKANPRKIF